MPTNLLIYNGPTATPSGEVIKIDIQTRNNKQVINDVHTYNFWEVAEQNMRVMEMKYFVFYCKCYYFYHHVELRVIL